MSAESECVRLRQELVNAGDLMSRWVERTAVAEAENQRLREQVERLRDRLARHEWAVGEE